MIFIRFRCSWFSITLSYMLILLWWCTGNIMNLMMC